MAKSIGTVLRMSKAMLSVLQRDRKHFRTSPALTLSFPAKGTVQFLPPTSLVLHWYMKRERHLQVFPQRRSARPFASSQTTAISSCFPTRVVSSPVFSRMVWEEGEMRERMCFTLAQSFTRVGAMETFPYFIHSQLTAARPS